MAEERENDGIEAAEPKKKSKKSFLKWIIVVTVLLFAGVAGFGGWKYYQSFVAGEKKAKEDQVARIGDVWPMGTMIVNLMDGNGERYLKAVIQIETSGPECISELNMLKPKIIDNILDLLSSKKYRDIVGFEGKQRLREEISMRVNNYISKGRIRYVYFTEFVIQ
jgi:flagellar FliL protein